MKLKEVFFYNAVKLPKVGVMDGNVFHSIIHGISVGRKVEAHFESGLVVLSSDCFEGEKFYVPLNNVKQMRSFASKPEPKEPTEAKKTTKKKTAKKAVKKTVETPSE